MNINRIPVILSLLVMLGLACSLVPGLATPGPVEEKSLPAATLQTTAPADAAPSLPAPTAAQPPAPEPTASASSPICVPSAAHAPLTSVQFEAYPLAIMDFLNAGASPGELDQALKDANIANRPLALLDGDLNGDGKTDLAVSIFNPASSRMPPESTLAVYVCALDAYRLAYEQTADTGAILWHFRDLDADGAAELVFSRSQCGAHTCFEDYHVLSGRGGNIQDTLLEGSGELPYPVLELQDPDGDHRFDLVITGSGIGSVGAGPQRATGVVYSYTPDLLTWVRTDTFLGPSNYRIHVLQDAEIAARQGDYTAAIGLYNQVIDNASLLDWNDPAKEQADLNAYAGFKLVVMYMLLEQPDGAKNSYNTLRASVGESAPQNDTVRMAAAFLEAYASGGLAAGCAEVETFAETHVETVLLPLNAFGYGNPGYTAADLCPYAGG